MPLPSSITGQQTPYPFGQERKHASGGQVSPRLRVPPDPRSPRMPRLLLVLAAAFVVSTYLGAIRLSDFPLAENPENVVGVLLAVSFALARFGRWQLWNGPAKYLLVFFGLSTVLTLGAYASDRDGARLRSYAQYAQAFMLYLIYFDLCRDRRAVKVLVSTFLVTTILLSLVANLGIGGAIGAAAAGRGGFVERVGVLGMNLNDQAFLYAAAITVVLCRGLARWPRFGRLDWVLSGGAVSMLVALLQTGSRGGLLTLTAGMAAALVLMFRGRRWAAYALLVPLVLYGLGSAVMSSEVVRARIEQTLYESDYGARDRLAEQAVDMLKERPLTGWGPNYTEELGARTGRLRIAAHNTYLQVATAFGLLGFVPWLLGLGATGWRLWRHRQEFWAGTALAIFFALLVAMVPGNYGYGRFAWIFLALAGAMPLGGSRPPEGRLLRPRGRRTFSRGGFHEARSPNGYMGRAGK